MSRRDRKLQAVAVEEPPINLTALIDVVFVILIMFILIAPLLEIDQIELAGASQHKSDPSMSAQEASPIAIHVTRDNKIKFNGREVTLQQLTPLLKQAKANYPKVRPQIFHDKRGHFGTYQGIKNSVEAAGFSEMDIVLAPE